MNPYFDAINDEKAQRRNVKSRLVVTFIIQRLEKNKDKQALWNTPFRAKVLIHPELFSILISIC